jgi:hypothetical protein
MTPDELVAKAVEVKVRLDDDWPAKVAKEAARLAFTEAAEIVAGYAESVNLKTSERSLVPRTEGDQCSLAYANALRSKAAEYGEPQP